MSDDWQSEGTAMSAEILTFEKIAQLWKSGEKPEGFADMIEKWLDRKKRMFGEIRVRDVARWVTQLAIVIEIGRKIDDSRFAKHGEYWRMMLQKDWLVDLQKGVVIWKD